MKHLTLRQSSKKRCQGDQGPHLVARLLELRHHPAAIVSNAAATTSGDP
jgi:hypothetical protein